MEIQKKRSVSDKLSKYCILTTSDDAFIEVTEWTNCEGYDIQINENKRISLTHGEIQAINYLVNTLEYQG